MNLPDNLKDTGTERALLGTIIKNGKDAYIDVSDIIGSTDLVIPLNQHIYRCIKELAENPNVDTFDVESIKAKAKMLGVADVFESKTALEYLEIVSSANFDADRCRDFAIQLKKLSVARDLYVNCQETTKYLREITGSESLSEIVSNVEEKIVNYTNGVDVSEEMEQIGFNLAERLRDLIDGGPIQQVGISTGFSLWDKAVGGGLRVGTVNVTGSRAKVGKSTIGINKAHNIAVQGIPVLYLDSEMTLQDQQTRLLCMHSGCPINLLETGQFAQDKNRLQRVEESNQEISQLPFHFISIVGKTPSEVLNIVRRWLVKHVGFNENGKANPCVVYYDYLKLTSGEELSSYTPEFIVLGLIMTKLHAFAVQYEIPIEAFVQLNRDGINTEDTSVISQSDRITWLCSNLTLLKNKDGSDEEIGCGMEFGNKKLVVLETRHGPGLNTDDYINIQAKMRPGVPDIEATGKMEEGYLFSQTKNFGQIYDEDTGSNRKNNKRSE